MGNVEFFKSFIEVFSKTQIEGGFPESHSFVLSALAILFGILTVICCLIVALSNKSCRAMGIVAAIFNFLNAVLMPAYIKSFHSTPFFKVEYIYGSSQEEVDQLVTEFYANYFAEAIPGMLLVSLVSTLMLLAFIFTLILIVKSMKVLKPKILPVFALILIILRYLFVGPIDYIKPLLQNGATVETQISQTVLYFVAITLPIILIAIGGIVAIAKKGKAPAVVEVASEVSVAETSPAEDAAAD